MPRYEWEVPPEELRERGPLCNIEISVPQVMIDLLAESDQPIPDSIPGPALIDTGASISAVDMAVLEALQINQVDVIELATPSNPQAIGPGFPARFIFRDKVIELSIVLGADLRPFNAIAIIGRDILSNCLLIYFGTRERVLLSY